MKLEVILFLGVLLFPAFLFSQESKKEKKDRERLEEGMLFLENNKKREGVVVLPSGLQYEIIKEGRAEKPRLKSEVLVHYYGTLINGKVFDSSITINKKKAISLPVNGVIKGWQEALQLMPVGSKWKLYIPYYLAYGEKSSGSIKPYSTLIFEVELIDIVKY